MELGVGDKGWLGGARKAWVGMACLGPGCMRRTALRCECALWDVVGRGLITKTRAIQINYCGLHMTKATQSNYCNP